MRHHVIGADGEEVACAQWPVRPLGHVGLRDLFDYGLSHAFLSRGLKSVCENLSSLKGLGCFSHCTQHSACGSVLG